MSRWNSFRNFSDEIPETPYEATVFLANAHGHLCHQQLTRNVLDARQAISGLMLALTTTRHRFRCDPDDLNQDCEVCGKQETGSGGIHAMASEVEAA